MIVCVDAGNTSTKIGAVERGRVLRVVTVPAGAGAPAVEAALRRVIRGRDGADACGLASVRPRATAGLRKAMARVCGTPPVVVGPGIPLPIRIAVRRPGLLGADRICAVAGALGTRRRSAIVIDVGTAITVNLVTGRVFRGGVIMPGPSLSLSALHAHTALLPDLDFEAGDFPPGGFDHTEASMRWGAGLAATGGIRAAVAVLERRAGRALPRVLTGGGAARLTKVLGHRYAYRPHLTLLGVEAIVKLATRLEK